MEPVFMMRIELKTKRECIYYQVANQKTYIGRKEEENQERLLGFGFQIKSKLCSRTKKLLSRKFIVFNIQKLFKRVK